jgi:molecular chaperone HtpG
VDEAERDRPGTTITLHLKPVDADNGIEDYADRWVLSRIVRQHADFIAYPILLPAEKASEVPEGETPEPEKAVNSQKPIWSRPPSEVTKEEYADFYRQISHDWSEPLETVHTRGEGLVEYQAVLFLPSRGTPELYSPSYKPSLRLYVKRMLVRENSEELLPRWLRWVRGRGRFAGPAAQRVARDAAERPARAPDPPRAHRQDAQDAGGDAGG